MVEKTNQNCEIRDTEICNFLGCDGCEKCTLSVVGKGTDPQESAARWRETLKLLPEDIDQLHLTDTCAFCGKEPKAVYGELGLGHIEPEYKKGIILGMGKKVRCAIGSLIDLPIACCKSCRKKMVLQDVLQYGIVLLFVILGFVLMSIPAISAPLEKIHFILPLGTAVLIIVIGYFLSKMAVKKYIAHCEKTMHMDPLQIPTVQKMVQMGWFPAPEVKNGYARVHFSKKKIRDNFRYFSE